MFFKSAFLLYLLSTILVDARKEVTGSDVTDRDFILDRHSVASRALLRRHRVPKSPKLPPNPSTPSPSAPNPSSPDSPTNNNGGGTSQQPTTTFPLPNGSPFKISPTSTLIDIWVDASSGSDAKSGNSPSDALKTLAAAWNRIPKGKSLTTGYRIHLVGTFQPNDQPNYWESRYGTPSAPIIIQGEGDGSRSPRLSPVNIFDTSHLYFINLQFDVTGGDQFHCELCQGILLRNLTITGKRGSTWEAVKLNQCTGMYIESCDISGADDNAIDMVAVQYGHIMDTKIHNANWCIYQKGGSAYHLVTRSEIYDCGESGYAAGQGTGLEYTVSPWLRYEAYDIKLTNNFIHDVWGAGLGVYGGQNILFAYNTLYKVGKRSHVMEVLLGSRSCDGENAKCASRNKQGGWGPVSSSQSPVDIPNLRVVITNNLVYNPSGYQSQWQQLTVANPTSVRSGTNVPGPLTRADADLVIRGNLFWNGPSTHPIGIEDGSSACAASNPTCNLAQLKAQNAFNTVDPQLSAYNAK